MRSRYSSLKRIRSLPRRPASALPAGTFDREERRGTGSRRRVSPTIDSSENIRLRLSAYGFGDRYFRSWVGTTNPCASRTLMDRARKFEQGAIARLSMNSLGVIAEQTGDPRSAESFFRMATSQRKPRGHRFPAKNFEWHFWRNPSNRLKISLGFTGTRRDRKALYPSSGSVLVRCSSRDFRSNAEHLKRRRSCEKSSTGFTPPCTCRRG